MNGADEYCEVFQVAEQVGRLYLLPWQHARGATFHIYVLPKGEKVIENGGINPPLNKDCVEVYGVISGNPGWTETYGWIHKGKWQEDFETLYQQRIKETEALQRDREAEEKARLLEEEKRTSTLLGDYS